MKKLFVVLFFLISTTSFSQTTRETRAVWVATNFHLDWPSLSYNEEIQKQELKEIFLDIKSKKLNTIYFQVRSNGTVFYNSNFEPYSKFLKGKTGDAPYYDPLSYAIQLAHSMGLEIHAWVNVVRVLSGSDMNPALHKWHVMKKHPEWIVKYWENNSSSYWLDMGIPEARQYLIDVISEIPINYNVDGIHLDFIRYPGKKFDDLATFKKYGENLSLDNWRRANINQFVENLDLNIQRINPTVKLGAAPLGIYTNNNQAYGLEARNDVYQESRTWLENKNVDYLAPQIYWDTKTNPDFEFLTNNWQQNSSGRNIVVGIAAYKPEVMSEINDQIEIVRKSGAKGFAFYRYSNIKNTVFSFSETPALPSEMDWLIDETPPSPINLTTRIPQNSKEDFILTWGYDDLSKKENVNYIGLYNSVKNDEKLYDVFQPEGNSVKVKIKEPKNLRYNFKIKALNSTWKESEEYSNFVTVQIPGIHKILTEITPTAKPILINYSKDKFMLQIYSPIVDTIEIKMNKENADTNLLYRNLNIGKNLIFFQGKITDYSTLEIKFLSNKKENILKLKQ